MSPTGASPEQPPREGSQPTVGQADHPLRQDRMERLEADGGFALVGVGSGERRHTHLPADREAPNARSGASRPAREVSATS